MTLDSLSDFEVARSRFHADVDRLTALLDEAVAVADEPTVATLTVQKTTLREARTRLANGHFTVGIVGQMNAGKSTLLNALLFGREVMSASATPHTAKLTEIRHGEVPRAVVHFFNQGEWDQVLRLNDKDAVLAATNTPTRGADGKSLIGETLVVNFEGVNQLDDALRPYVAVATAGETSYTPLVRNVDLVHPLPGWASSVVWLDTPGTNDPVASRSKVTLDKLTDLDAVLVVLTALQPLSRNDLNLLAEQLLPTGISSLFVLVNRIDDLSDRSLVADVQTYVQDTLLREASALPQSLQRALATAPVYPVSGMAALFGRANGQIRDADYYANTLTDSFGSLDSLEVESGLPNLEADLSRFLASQKGAQLLALAGERIVHVAGDATARMEKYSERLKLQSRNLEASRQQLEAAIRTLDAEKAKLQKQKDDILNRVDLAVSHSMTDLSEQVGRELRTHKKTFVEKADSILAEASRFSIDKAENALQISLSYIVSEATDIIRTGIYAKQSMFTSNVNDIIRGGTGRLSAAADAAFGRLRWDQIVPSIPRTLNIDPVSGFFGRLDKLKKSYIKGFNEWDLGLMHALKAFEDQVRIETSSTVSEAMNSVLEDISAETVDKQLVLRDKTEGIGDVDAKQKTLDAERSRVDAVAESLAAERDRLAATAFSTPNIPA